jgi:hypothetical protein
MNCSVLIACLLMVVLLCMQCKELSFFYPSTDDNPSVDPIDPPVTNAASPVSIVKRESLAKTHAKRVRFK